MGFTQLGANFRAGLALNPLLKRRLAESPQLPDVNSLDLAFAGKPLEGFWMDADKSRCFVAIKKGFGNKHF